MDFFLLFSNCLISKNSKNDIFCLSFPSMLFPEPCCPFPGDNTSNRSILSSFSSKFESVSSEMELGFLMGVLGQINS
jgi:hypothetical protein